MIENSLGDAIAGKKAVCAILFWLASKLQSAGDRQLQNAGNHGDCDCTVDVAGLG
jgi:hypothetical protein